MRKSSKGRRSDGDEDTIGRRPRARRVGRLPLALALGSALIAALSGCGKQEYTPVTSSATAQGGGGFTIPPKVDIVLVQDDTGSAYEIQSALQQDLQGFLAQLDQEGWDYHFGAFPLTHQFTISQIIASKYDGNWQQLGQWKPPYPGASPNAPGTVGAAYFQTPQSYSGFFGPNESNSTDWGFYYLISNLHGGIPSGANLIRPDAMLAVLFVTNGQDSSSVNYCDRGDGIMVPCESVNAPDCTSMNQTAPNPTAPQPASCGSQSLSLSTYISSFQAFKPLPSLLKVYAAVGDGVNGGVTNNGQTDSCLGGPSYLGSRYISLAQSLGGAAFDICNQDLTSVLSSMSSDLQSIFLQVHTRYLFTSQAPNVSTITVTETSADGSTTKTIPQDPNNGWIYVGYQSNIYAIDYPVAMDQSSGYAIRLNGTAVLVGNETAKVTYTPAGVQPSH